MIRITAMTADHVSAVAQLERVCFSAPWSENSIRAELSNPLSLWLVAYVDAEFAGYIGSQSVCQESDMMNVAVSPQFRRMGIGEALVSALARELKTAGNEKLTLEVRASNENAIALYQKLSFVQIGRRPNYYRNPKEDALILQKIL